MNERAALMRAICDNPDEDTPRLVFADWLQEHGEDDRAEFIRLQCRLASVLESSRSIEDIAHEGALLKTHANAWLEPFAEFRSAGGGTAQFRRGFVEVVDTTVEAMRAGGERLLALAPVRELCFADETDYAPLARCKWFSRLRALRLSASGRVEAFVVAPLLKSRHLTNLKVLALRNPFGEQSLDRTQVRALVTAKSLRNLEELDLSGNCFNDWNAGAFEELMLRADFPALRKLNLNATTLHDEEAELLAATSWIARLRELRVNWNEIREDGLQAILESPHLENIEYLDLSYGAQRVDYFEPDHPFHEVKRLLAERFGNRVCFNPY